MHNGKKIFVLILFILIIALTSFKKFLLFVHGDEIEDEEKIVLEKINLSDEFDDKTIIIVMKHKESLKFKEYTVSDFSEIDCIDVADLTENTAKIVKAQIEAKNTGNWTKLEERIYKNMLIDIDKFHRILCLTIENEGKENVVADIKKLEKRNDIISVEPNYA